eukprot:PhF_6_TR1054/c0_g2_i2/m.2191
MSVPLPKDPCAICNTKIESCKCPSCEICGTAFSLTLHRHHCRKCNLPSCHYCRTRQRQIKYVGNYAMGACCDKCARRIALVSVAENTELTKKGLLLLLEGADLPKRCMDPECGTFHYQKDCVKCGLPMIPTGLYEDRAVRINTTKNDATRRVKALETKYQDLRTAEMASLCASVPSYVQSLQGLTVPRFSEKADLNTKMLLGLICAGLCYEYNFYPHYTLHEHILPWAKSLRMLSTQQLYSTFEAPGKLKIVAFPGTHDARTATTDIKFARTDLTGPGGQIYKVHTGFYTEAGKVYLPEVLNWMNEGYEVVYCGHSLGGAIATLATTHMIFTHTDQVQGKLTCVTAGAPAVGNHQWRGIMGTFNAHDSFHHFVYRGDPVPRVLMGREAPKKVRVAIKTLAAGAATKGLALGQTAVAALGGLFGKKKEEAAPPRTESPPPEAQPPAQPEEEETLEIEAVEPSKRCFEYFGTYHLMALPGLTDSPTIVQSSDSEVVYQSLKAGLKTIYPTDHFMETYLRAVIRQGMYGSTMTI